MLRQTLRRSLRQIAIRFPALQRVSGRLGLGRLIAPADVKELITIDGDITLELDMSVPAFRYLYFHHDLTRAPETELLRTLLRDDDVLVDVGAHIGVYALVAAKYAASVHAFEISQGTTARLRRNVALNPRLAPKITVHDVGLADTPGELQLYNSAAQPDLASLRPLARADAFSETVAVTTLDACLAEVPISWLKIDVEGAELGVLRGAAAHLAATHPWVLLEMFEPFQRRFGGSCAELDAFLTARGYVGFQLLEGRHAHHALPRTPPTGAPQPDQPAPSEPSQDEPGIAREGLARRGGQSGDTPARRTPQSLRLAPLDLSALDQVQVNNVLYVPRGRRHLLPEAWLEG